MSFIFFVERANLTHIFICPLYGLFPTGLTPAQQNSLFIVNFLKQA
jgi:hypothetical protein